LGSKDSAQEGEKGHSVDERIPTKEEKDESQLKKGRDFL
jgi:hypothetical protein